MGQVDLARSAYCVALKGKTCLSGGPGLDLPSRQRNYTAGARTEGKVEIHYTECRMKENVYWQLDKSSGWKGLGRSESSAEQTAPAWRGPVG